MHSAASDGELSPAALVNFAAGLGVTTMAVTDHDTVSGVAEAREAAWSLRLTFYSGIEISSLWGTRCIHVVGLGLNETDEDLENALRYFSEQRADRARRISQKLVDLGCPDVYERVMDLAPNKDNISRLHFARALVQEGVVDNQDQAFKQFLGDNAPAFVMAAWPTLEQAVSLIRRSGGVAVLAHPGRYAFKKEWMLDELVAAFVKAGGTGIEVVSGSQSRDFIPRCAAWANQYHLAASTGSDFHHRHGLRPLPGQQGDLPENLELVTDRLPVFS